MWEGGGRSQLIIMDTTPLWTWTRGFVSSRVLQVAGAYNVRKLDIASFYEEHTYEIVTIRPLGSNADP
jgi:hypothetical protein